MSERTNHCENQSMNDADRYIDHLIELCSACKTCSIGCMKYQHWWKRRPLKAKNIQNLACENHKKLIASQSLLQ